MKAVFILYERADCSILENKVDRGRSEHIANIITSCRILCSIVLLFPPVFSPWFYVFYLLNGLTDMIDGTIARKTGSVSEFGSNLDTVADFIFVVACLIKLLPAIDIPIEQSRKLGVDEEKETYVIVEITGFDSWYNIKINNLIVFMGTY